jgi:signal transduction histidine kinase
MNFRVTARTILQLGAELISSDAVAFYELIKNAFDAGSPNVEINLVVRIPSAALQKHRGTIAEELKTRRKPQEKEQAFERARASIAEDLDEKAPEVNAFRSELDCATDWKEVSDLLDRANYILISDTGHGMSKGDLEDIYLTIGTRFRRKERQTAGNDLDHVILGEKGLGRLSVMRLGMGLKVHTTKAHEPKWNVLEVDWRRFSHDSDELLEQVEVSPRYAERKSDPSEQGTQIQIWALSSGWDREQLEQVAADQFSKFTDPFVPASRNRIVLRYNGKRVRIPPFERLLFDAAHAKVEASFTTDGGIPRFSGAIHYSDRDTTFELDEEHLFKSSGGASQQTLVSLGPFTVRFYWYNRQALKAVEGLGNQREVRAALQRWAGGLKLYRDGFRVNPYGDPDDDWLDLDRKALSVSSFKVNRTQIVGKVDITAGANPTLTDQTNREGLRRCNEKDALVSLLKHLLESELRGFLIDVDKEVQARQPLSVADIDKRVGQEEKRVLQSLRLLEQTYPDVDRSTQVVTNIKESIEHIRELIEEARDQVASYRKGRTELLHLAGLGLMMEILAHELNRVTQQTLRTLESSKKSDGEPVDMSATVETLEWQLNTLQKRLQILDPLSTPARQVKQPFDLVELLESLQESHAAQFQRHHIDCRLEFVPARPTRGFFVTMVKGMIIQIIENLISNSVYWLEARRVRDREFSPKLTITLDSRARQIRVTDNGPGVPKARREEIFQAFVTTKPPGQGKGLGLYISREIAKYHGATLEMADHPDSSGRSNHLNTFALSLGEK